jgi:sulfide dehydrogenase [flavocytochrome c] flavoprotein subunit
VINVIPPQSAGKIAIDAGLADDSGWCPVDKKTFESTLMPGVHVIGDACHRHRHAQVRLLRQQPGQGRRRGRGRAAERRRGRHAGLRQHLLLIIGKDYGISVAAVYRLSEDGSTIAGVEGAGG